ncbi:MAG: hypothetical protein GX364_04460 [Firmicutes bacterium]|jgi:parallel beta-helix repeat protein|nr:hypothetical protein [Bacillota bacterium]
MGIEKNKSKLSLTILVIFALSLLALPVFSLGTDGAQDDMPALSQVEGDVYVSAEDGDDDEGDGTPENPYATIQKGVDEVDEGGVVRVLAGEYLDYVEIGKSVSIIGDGWKKTNFTSDEEELPTIWIGDLREDKGEEPLAVWIEGMNISEGCMGILSENVEDLKITVLNCHLEYNDCGAILLTAENNIDADIRGNYIYGNNCCTEIVGGGIRMVCYGEELGGAQLAEDGLVPKITADIRDNVIAGNEGGGIRLGWWRGDITDSPGDITATIEGNRIYNNEGGSLRVKSSGEVDVTVTKNDFQLTDYELNAGGVIRIGQGSEDYDNDISEKVKARVCGNVINCGKAGDEVEIGGVIRVNGDEIEAEISGNEITAGYDVGGLIRVGQSGKYSGLVATNVTAEITDNVMDLDTYSLGGGIRVYAKDEIDAIVTGNRFGGVPWYQGGGIRIGHFANYGGYSEFDYPPTETVKAVVSDNHLTHFEGGGIRIIASEEIEAEVNNNTVSECYGGAIRVGWFCYDREWENTEGDLTGVTPVVSAEISGNTLTDNRAVGIHLEGSVSVSGTISGNRVLGTMECNRYRWGEPGDYRYDNPGIYVGNEDADEVDVSINNNAIVGNVTGLICEIDESADPLDATQNWWGNAYGPFNLNLSLPGEIVGAGIFFEFGDTCSGNLDVSPWLLSEPPATETLVTETLWLEEGDSAGIEGLLSVKAEKGEGGITFAQYGSNPAPVPPIGEIGGYFDVYHEADFLEAGDIDSLFLKLFYDDEDLPAGVMEDRVTLLWWNGEKWVACSESGIAVDITPQNEAETGKHAWARITAYTTPSIADLLVGGFTIGEPALYGDVYRDGEVDVLDAILMLRSIVGLEELNDIQMALALVSGNDILTVRDVILVLRHAVGLIDRFPVE